MFISSSKFLNPNSLSIKFCSVSDGPICLLIKSFCEASQKDFIKRHIGPSDTEQNFMLKELGFKNLDELINKTVPELFCLLVRPNF